MEHDPFACIMRSRCDASLDALFYRRGIIPEHIEYGYDKDVSISAQSDTASHKGASQVDYQGYQWE